MGGGSILRSDRSSLHYYVPLVTHNPLFWIVTLVHLNQKKLGIMMMVVIEQGALEVFLVMAVLWLVKLLLTIVSLPPNFLNIKIASFVVSNTQRQNTMRISNLYLGWLDFNQLQNYCYRFSIGARYIEEQWGVDLLYLSSHSDISNRCKYSSTCVLSHKQHRKLN